MGIASFREFVVVNLFMRFKNPWKRYITHFLRCGLAFVFSLLCYNMPIAICLIIFVFKGCYVTFVSPLLYLENFTMGASFGTKRDLVFIKEDDVNCKFNFPQFNGDVFALKWI